MSKAMCIGLSPEYNYPGKFELWCENNTRFASNHGASLISRSICQEFNADYVDDFSNIDYLNDTYDVCFVALATHIHAHRDISYYVDIIKKLEMKVVALSLGVEDYVGEDALNYTLHPSVISFLEVVSEKSNLIGVRGHYTASILYRAGFSNVLAIGCPTLYSNRKASISVNKTLSFSKPLCVYHCSIAESLPQYLEDMPILGQDFQDHCIFTDELDDDERLKSTWEAFYNRVDPTGDLLKSLGANVMFPRNFDGWLKSIKEHDFIFGPRLHANIAALINGIPAVMFARDLRVREIAEFFDIPFVTYQEAAKSNLGEIYHNADFSRFEETFRLRYQNFLYFLRRNDIDHGFGDDHQSEFQANGYDHRITRFIGARSLSNVGPTDLDKLKWNARARKVKSMLQLSR